EESENRIKTLPMLKNQIKLAWRSLTKNKFLSLINIAGLTIGIAGVLIVGSFIFTEVSVNKWIKNRENIYLLGGKMKNGDLANDIPGPAALPKALLENYPGLVKNYYHHDGVNSIVSRGDKKFNDGLMIGDSSFIEMFGFQVLHGDRKTALNDPDKIVITESGAKKYFGRTNVVGETLTIHSFNNSTGIFEISAVLKDPPFNTITYFGIGSGQGENQLILPASSLKFFGENRERMFNAWENTGNGVSYIELKEGVRPELVLKAVDQLIRLHSTGDVIDNLKMKLTPISSHYLESGNGIAKRLLYGLGFSAFFILMMALINFINLTVGSSYKRIREIGVMKVLGSTRLQLGGQFLLEAMFMAAFATALALMIYTWSLPFVSDMFGRKLPFLTEFPFSFYLIPFFLIFFTGLLAGIYPAFFLSRQGSVSSLKGKLETVDDNRNLRQGMIGLQFTVAFLVFVSAIVINEQVDYFFKKDLGYQKDKLISVRLPRDWSAEGVKHMEMIRNEFASLPQVAGASVSFEIPDGSSGNANTAFFRADQDSTMSVIGETIFCDEHYLSAFRIPVLAGEFFNEKGGPVQLLDIVLNERAVRSLGWKNAAEAIGKKVRFPDFPDACTIKGVIADFHFGPLNEEIRPIIFGPLQLANSYRYLSVRLKPGSTLAALAAVGDKWKALLPDAPFEYRFMDEILAKLYRNEERMKKASMLATIIALIIVLLGVAGIVTLAIARRTKELGIRKVLGASFTQIVFLFTKEFGTAFLIAICISLPLSYMVLKNWLNNYPYRIELGMLPFVVVAIVLALLVSLLVSFLIGRLNNSSIVNSLKSD
ncbi:MAG TPA: ABC transporter permease, partial [Chitinophagaceae bacterium]|nr:ABC transporter permease [Chitinophagaceae bacterium]